MYIHQIPTNILDNGNLMGGFLKRRNTIEAGIILLGMFLIFKIALFAVPFMVQVVLFVIFAICPAIIAVMGIGDESLSEALFTYMAYRKTPDMLSFNLAEMFPEEAEDEQKTKDKRKEKREEKKRTKKDKKEAKKAQRAAKKLRRKAGLK